MASHGRKLAASLLLAVLLTALPLPTVLSLDDPGQTPEVVNPPGSGFCPKFDKSEVPPDWSNGDVIASTPGWVKGKLYKYDLPSVGSTHVGSVPGVFASTCYKLAACREPSYVKYVSWVARTNEGTKGNCHFFIDSTCSPRNAGDRYPFIPDKKDWYTAEVFGEQVDCDTL